MNCCFKIYHNYLEGYRKQNNIKASISKSQEVGDC